MRTPRVQSSAPFELRYAKDCACGERMAEGTTVRYRNGKIEHIRCSEVHFISQSPEQIRARVCGTCFLVHGAEPCDR